MTKEFKTDGVKLGFKDLSWPLKLVIILGWFYGVLLVYNLIGVAIALIKGQ